MLDLRTLPILVVDDNRRSCDILDVILKGAGVSDIKMCDSPAEALALLPYWHPGMILTDYRMDPVDGLGFARELRSNPEYCFLSKPIVLLTAETPNAQLVEGVKAAGIDTMVTKPILPALLFKRMDWALTQARLRTEQAIRTAKAAIAATECQPKPAPPSPQAEPKAWEID